MSRIRPWHILIATNIALLCALVWSNTGSRAQTPAQDVVRARMIELVNERGEMRAQLHVAENGGGELRLRNASGDIRMKLGATDDGAIVLLMDADSNPTVRLASQPVRPAETIASDLRESPRKAGFVTQVLVSGWRDSRSAHGPHRQIKC